MKFQFCVRDHDYRASYSVAWGVPSGDEGAGQAQRGELAGGPARAQGTADLSSATDVLMPSTLPGKAGRVDVSSVPVRWKKAQSQTHPVRKVCPTPPRLRNPDLGA